jgi:hypothetical protein
MEGNGPADCPAKQSFLGVYQANTLLEISAETLDGWPISSLPLA